MVDVEVDLNVTHYYVSVDRLGTHSVPADSVCPSMAGTTCTYSYPVPSFSLPSGRLDGHVAAKNGIGLGQNCSLPSAVNIGTAIFVQSIHAATL